MPKSKSKKSLYKVSRKRKKNSKQTTDKAQSDNLSTASSSSKLDDENGKSMVKPPKQSKIEEPIKSVQGTDDDSFDGETTDDADMPNYSGPLILNETLTGDDSSKLEESTMSESSYINAPDEMQIAETAHREPQSAGIHEEPNPDDPPIASPSKSETEDKQQEPQISSVPQESNIKDSTTEMPSETEITECKPQTSSVPGELKLEESSPPDEEKEQQESEPAEDLETGTDTDGSSTITCSSKARYFSDTGSDKESANSNGSKAASLSSENKECDAVSVYSYPTSDESGPPSVASTVSSIRPLEIDLGSAEEESPVVYYVENYDEYVKRRAAELLSKKYKEFSSSDDSNDNGEET